LACQLIRTMSPESWILARFRFCIYIFSIFRPCGIETKVFHHTQPFRVIHSLSFQLKKQDFANTYHVFWENVTADLNFGLRGLG
jgi:hypothetical protein